MNKKKCFCGKPERLGVHTKNYCTYENCPERKIEGPCALSAGHCYWCGRKMIQSE